MIVRTLVFATLFTLSLVAHAEMQTVVNGLETAISSMRLPIAQSGTVSFKPCESNCDTETFRVNESTRYRINGDELSLADFSSEVVRLRQGGEQIATVLYDVKSQLVTRIQIGS